MTQLLDALGSARVGRKRQCPAHGTTGEHAVSLSLKRGEHGQLLLFCHAGCGWPDILRALVVPMSAMWTPPPTPPDRHARLYLRRLRFPPPKAAGTPQELGFRFEAEHPYGTPEPFAWKIRLRHPTTREKSITWESLNPRGERVLGLLGRRQADFPLYLERDVRMGVAAGEPVLLVESESSVDALVKAGFYATTWAGGAADPPIDRIVELLALHAGALLIPDNDDAGRACAARLVRGGAVRRLLLGEPGEDARDLLDRVGSTEFRRQVDEALEAPMTPAGRTCA